MRQPPTTERGRVCLWAEMLMAAYTGKFGMGVDEAKRRVMEKFRTACGPLDADAHIKPDVIDGQADYWISPEGFFRVIAATHNANMLDPYVQERWAKWIRNTIGGEG